MIERWDNVKGTFSVEFYQHEDGRFLDVWDDEPVHPIVKKYLTQLDDDQHAELVIKFAASGYHDSGSMYGGADNMGWAPEGDEERIVTEVFIEADHKNGVGIDEEDWKELADYYNDSIYEVEIEKAY